MNSKKNNHALQKSIIWKQSKKWDQEKYKRVKESIQIRIKKNNEIVYSTSDGEILRIEKPQEYLINHFLFNNKDQIKNLLWFCEYRQSNRQYQKWSATWGGEVLRGVGGYINNGLKEGPWKELIQNYSSQVIVYQIGQYQNDKKKGIWEFMYKNNKIGSGLYNEQGQKHCKWRELSHDFSDQSQITLNGEYKNGKKIGRWDILFKRQIMELIGGGQYSFEGDGVKNGRWTEINFNFSVDLQLTYNGEYKNGKKIGQWDICYRDRRINKFEKIGGGLYLQGGDGQKVGKWIELSDQFKQHEQISYAGEYNKNGKKVGRWDIWYKDSETKYNEQIGGGCYDQEGQGVKIGSWIELCEGFKKSQLFSKEITYNGEYIKDRKVGRWNIMYREWNKESFHQIGYGYYDERGDGIKIGKWMELSYWFYVDRQITYIGEYKNGKKIGTWFEFEIKKNEIIKEMKYDD
ncbi:unnamed protein product [Paramecium pentaurelia]|uniref:Uncharacterized protein n=1 Tax=Paramecium pentaurelia TaxID=43138 RepID=A0A8S1XGB7_9CILI|nr:unnamed protein product [Paramecium pentaurelia]